MSPPLPRGGGSQARQMMRHRARVLQLPAETAYGQQHDDEPTELHAALPCYAWTPTDAREVLDDDTSATLGAVRLVMPLDCGITELDIIDSVVDRAGRVVFDGPLKVTATAPQGGCLAVMARATRSAD